MSDNNNNDDAATVVVNIKDLKDEYEKVDETSKIDDLEFSSTHLPKSNRKQLLAFDFKSKTFETLVSKMILPNDTRLVSELNELNIALKESPDSCVLLNYHVEAKAVNKLLNQIKKLYPASTTILMAKGLTEEIVQKHNSSPARADEYLNFPFNIKQIDDILES